ncbi:MAG: cation-transporting P-type ATPase, partial [Rhodanobacteraceae bacterium]
MLQTPLNDAPKVAARNGAATARPRVAEQAWRANAELLHELGTSLAGLDEQQIESRLDHDGANEVSHEKLPHWSRQLLRAFWNPFIIVLVVLAVVQLLTSDDFTGPFIIAVMVLIS